MLPKTIRHSKADGKEDTKGKGPKGTSPTGQSNKPVCFHLQKEQCKRNPHALIGTRQTALTTNPKVDASADTCVFKHTGKAGEDGQVDTFSGRSFLKKQFRVRYCRNVERHFRERDRRERVLLNVDETMIAIRTLLLVRIRIAQEKLVC